MDNILYIALSRYFNALSKLGYMSHSDVDKIIVLMFIRDLLEDNCNKFMTEETQRNIDNVLYCIYGTTCLISYPKNTENSLSTCNK